MALAVPAPLLVAFDIDVSTYADLAPLPASSAYAVSKGAGRIFTRALRADIADLQVSGPGRLD